MQCLLIYLVIADVLRARSGFASSMFKSPWGLENVEEIIIWERLSISISAYFSLIYAIRTCTKPEADFNVEIFRVKHVKFNNFVIFGMNGT